MSRFGHIASEEVVRHNRATNGSNAYRAPLNAQLINGFGNKPVHNTMDAARTIIRYNGKQRVRTLENNLLFSHVIHPPLRSTQQSLPKPLPA